MFERYQGTIWHRVKMLVRGVTGLVFALYLTAMTLFLLLLEIGNRAWDIILEEDEYFVKNKDKPCM